MRVRPVVSAAGQRGSAPLRTEGAAQQQRRPGRRSCLSAAAEAELAAAAEAAAECLRQEEAEGGEALRGCSLLRDLHPLRRRTASVCGRARARVLITHSAH